MLDGPEHLNALSEAVIGACIEVHTILGPGLPESAYEEALAVELAHRGVAFERQALRMVHYKNRKVGEVRLDLVVDGKLVIELKSVETLSKLHESQVTTYLRVTGLHLGLLINFNVTRLTQGVRRVVNKLSSSAPSASLRHSAINTVRDHL